MFFVPVKTYAGFPNVRPTVVRIIPGRFVETFQRDGVPAQITGKRKPIINGVTFNRTAAQLLPPGQSGTSPRLTYR